MRKLFRFIKRLIGWLTPIGIYVRRYKKQDPDKYRLIWKDGDFTVIVYNRKVFGVWYQPRRRKKKSD